MTGTCAPKRRNSERRKEKSRDAARSRRGKEAEVFYSLSSQIPLPPSTRAQMDKAAVMRIILSYLKIRQVLGDCEKYIPEVETLETKIDHQYIKALDGFVMVMSSEGDMWYLSESISKHLGLTQIDLMGQSVFEYSHPCDHEEIQEVLSGTHHADDEVERNFFMRLKCTLTPKGRNVNLKSATYKVLKCSGRIITTEVEGANSESSTVRSLVLTCEPIPHPANIEMPLDTQTFLSRHSMDMKYTYCDERVEELLGYEEADLLGKSVYSYHHASDHSDLVKSFKNLFSKGQTMTGRYRFLAKDGGYAWVITQGTVIQNNRSPKPQCVVCVNYVISGVEENGAIFSQCQKREKVKVTRKLPALPPRMHLQAEMETVLGSSDPEYLDRLAPAAGGVCVPLGFPGAGVNLYDDILFPSLQDHSYEKPLNVKVEPTQKPQDADYRFPTAISSPSETNQSSLSSPQVMSLSNSPQCSPGSDSYIEIDMLERLNAMEARFKPGIMPDKTQDSMEDVELEMRSPYIPMSGEDTPFSRESAFHPVFNRDTGDVSISVPILGRTESVFSPLPPDPETTSKSRSFLTNMRRLQNKRMASEMLPNRKELIPKTPLSTNQLETGPPTKKPRWHTPAQKEQSKMANSVLLNLLTTGEDINNGYTVSRGPHKKQILGTTGPTRPSSQSLGKHLQGLMPSITRMDAEVNAPSHGLLQGKELLTALDGSAAEKEGSTGPLRTINMRDILSR
ncbi:unnamed protein product [Owenia fusiformis]|uniref:Uncharacterized protein n=1 Tax=Owenia fusiformis TaxID=6347 RepID=A0A8J1XX13_OWEFU|nr:unnamed protein product [Owenia fusiformis]